MTVDSSGKSWCFAPSGSIRPFSRIIRVKVLEHLEGNSVRIQWAKQGTFVLRFNDELAEEIKTWKVGSRRRIKCWADRIDEILPLK